MKKYKKGLLIISAIFLLGFINSCEGLKSRIIDIDNLKVAYVINSGGLKGKSLAEGGYEGIKRAENEFGVNVDVLEGDIKNGEGFQNDLKKIAERNDLIIVIGDEFKPTVNAVANNYRDKKFGIIGEGMKESNIQDIVFRYEEGGFLMGALAGKETKSNEVAFIGTKNQTTDRLVSGYISGVKITNEGAFKKLIDGENIKYIENYLDEAEVAKVASELYSSGVDIIFTNLEYNVSEVLNEAKKASGKYVIGFGMDAKGVIEGYGDNILSSLMVKTDDVVYGIIKEVEEGEFKSGEKNSKYLGLKDGMLDIAPSTEDIVRRDTFTLLMGYKNDIINNKIKVPKTRLEVIEYKIVK